jgi:hypothetical protein
MVIVIVIVMVNAPNAACEGTRERMDEGTRKPSAAGET